MFKNFLRVFIGFVAGIGLFASIAPDISRSSKEQLKPKAEKQHTECEECHNCGCGMGLPCTCGD